MIMRTNKDNKVMGCLLKGVAKLSIIQTTVDVNRVCRGGIFQGKIPEDAKKYRKF